MALDVVGSQGIDGTYTVTGTSFNVGTNETNIVVTPSLPTTPPPDLLGTIVIDGIDVTQWFQYTILTIDSASQTVVVYGNATFDIQPGQQIQLINEANTGIFTVNAITYDSSVTTTTLSVAESLVDSIGGWVESLYDLGMHLVFEDHIGVSVGEEATAAVLTTSGSLVGAWDYSGWDTGSFDENVDTVIHLYSNTFTI